MYQSIDAARKKKVDRATRNLEEMMKRIEPFIKRPKVSGPEKRHNWICPDDALRECPQNIPEVDPT